jgi:hypothetical protein
MTPAFERVARATNKPGGNLDRAPPWSLPARKPRLPAAASTLNSAALCGCTRVRAHAAESIMFAQGFSTAVLDGIVRAGLAVVATGTVRAGVSMITVLRFRITETGRKAIDDA